MQFRVFSLDQPGGTFYYAKAKFSALRGRLNVIRRSAGFDGVQRDLDGKRVKEISGYLATADAILPTPLVISVKFAELEPLGDGYGILSIPLGGDGLLGEIIDGQHRYWGLINSTGFDDSEVPLCVFVDLMAEDKATVFSTINSTQVKVPKSYIYDLFDYTDSNTPAKFGHDVCKTLNYDPDGPLSRRIKMLGRKLNDGEVLSQAALVDAIIPLITKSEKQDDSAAREKKQLVDDPDLPLRQFYISGSTVVFSKIVRNYLSALREVAGDNWGGYVLKSIGIKVFMRVMGVLAKDGLTGNDLSKGYFLRRLSQIEGQIRQCTTKAGTNKRAEDEAVAKLLSDLKP